jgi:hypothetical protein
MLFGHVFRICLVPHLSILCKRLQQVPPFSSMETVRIIIPCTATTGHPLKSSQFQYDLPLYGNQLLDCIKEKRKKTTIFKRVFFLDGQEITVYFVFLVLEKKKKKKKNMPRVKNYRLKCSNEISYRVIVS